MTDWQRQYGQRLRLGKDCAIPADLRLEIADGGLVVIGDRAGIGPGTTIQAVGDGVIVIGDDVTIGDNAFLSAMTGIRVGSGADIGTLCEIRDHSHCLAAPIIIESGAVVTGKTTVAPGVRIGQNSVVAANSLVSQSIGPNMVVAGAPARAIRTFDGPLRKTDARHVIRIAWFGAGQGYLRRLALNWRTTWPYLGFDVHGHDGYHADEPHDTDGDGARDGAASGVLRRAREWAAEGGTADLAFLGPCGDHDAYRETVRMLADASQRLVCVGEVPFGCVPGGGENVASNAGAARIAAEEGIDFIDVWPAFTSTASQFSGWADGEKEETLWSDGARLSDLGDVLMARLVNDHVREHQLIEAMTTYQRLERGAAARAYHALFADVR
jgi:acetyltransferase-like isoleucine patch superfamily enzyme